MKRKTTIIILIALLLLTTGGIFAWMLHEQQAAQEAKAGQAAAAEHMAKMIGDVSSQVAQESEEALGASLAAEHVYSHRGASADETEHTIAAYDRAIKDGAIYIEQDIVISKDGTLYVSHDDSAARIAGVNRRYRDMTDAEIDQLRTADGQKILRLSEVFDRYGTKVNYIIELKDKAEDTIDGFQEVVDRYGFADCIIVQCFAPDVLQKLEEIYPDMPKLLLCKTQAEVSSGWELPYVDIISVERSLMTRSNCDQTHDSGKQFNVWVLDEEDDILRALEMKVDTYFTNDTASAFAAEQKYRNKTAPKAQKKDGPATLFFASDFQPQVGWQSPGESLAETLKAVHEGGKTPDKTIILGDYTNDRTLYNHQLSPKESITQIRQIVQKEFPQIGEDDMLFVQGNHDRLTESIASSGLHEYDDYLIYVLNTENDFPWKQGKTTGALKKVKRSSKEMKECFDELIRRGETRPVFIAGHVPLHFTARTSPRHSTGDNLYASLIFNVVNDAAKSLDIVYLYGHNHSKGWDCYLGGSCVYKPVGDTVLIPAFEKTDVNTSRFTEETLNFTYLNGGYTGYFMNCGTDEIANGTADEYDAADDTLTGTVCEIYPGQIVLTRYCADGVHDLGSDGEADPYKGGVDRDLIDEKYYSQKIASPQKVTRKKAN